LKLKHPEKSGLSLCTISLIADINLSYITYFYPMMPVLRIDQIPQHSAKLFQQAELTDQMLSLLGSVIDYTDFYSNKFCL